MPKIDDIRTLHDGWGRFHLVTVLDDDGDRFVRQLDDHGDAVAVLPYDPHRQTVMLVRQLRVGPLFNGEHADMLELPAGLIDDGEAADDAARREVREETGLALDTLEPLGALYASPGVSSERIHIYLAAYSPSDRVSAGGGAQGEHEKIEVIEIDIVEAHAMTRDGRIADMKTFAALQTLEMQRRSPGP